MYNFLARVCPHVGHRGASGQAGGNSLPGRGRGTRGADLGQETREEKKNPAVPAKQGSEMKYRETSADAKWSQFALQRLFCGFREAALSWDKAL